MACDGRKLLNKNRISELSDDILLEILSSLTMKEAGRTSVLSKRWRHVWSYMPTLNFDSCNISHEISLARKAWEVEMSRCNSLNAAEPTYVRWVDQVVSSHNAPIIDEFRVQCHIKGDISGQSVDNWVRFAMEKRVKRLGMDFSPSHGRIQRGHYTFPSSLSSSLRCCNSLTSLELSTINVTGEALEIFLQNCPLLEFLSVSHLNSLVYLKVVGPSLTLKYLILYYCVRMKHLEISAPNLVYFKYSGPKISVPFKSTPKLAELSIGGAYGRDVTNNFMEHSSYLSQLEALTLDLQCEIEEVFHSDKFPDWTRLKKLEVKVIPDSDECLIFMRELISECPFLHKCVLQLEFMEFNSEDKREVSREMRPPPHYYLKIVEIAGFVGHVMEFEFAIYVLDVAVSLEKIIVDPREPSRIGSAREYESCKAKRANAKLLSAFLKPGTDLVIL